MPLVPESLYAQWFKRTSWVYRSFAFLFSNPLWDKDVPKGFSLCPFFWLAIFSLVVFRPFVYALLGIRYLIGLLRIGRLIRWTDGVVINLTDGGCGRAFAMPTLLGVMTISTVALALGCFVAYGIQTWQVGIFVAFAAPLFLFVTLTTCLVMADSHPNCKVEVYSRIATVLAVLAAFVLKPAAAAFAFFEIPWAIVSGIGYLIVLVVSSVWSWIAAGLAWTGNLIWANLGFSLTLLALSAAVSLYGYIAMRYFSGPDTTSAGTNERGLSAAERKRRLRELAEAVWVNDVEYGHLYRSTSWYYRMFARFEDALFSCLDGFDWNAEQAARNISPELRAKIMEEFHRGEEKRRRNDLRCQQVTAALSKLFKPVTVVGHQLAILATYLWALVKAKKQGACPYLKFRD